MTVIPSALSGPNTRPKGAPNANPNDLLCFIHDCLLTIDETLAFPYLSLLKRGESTPLSLVGFLNRVLFVSLVSLVSLVSFVSFVSYVAYKHGQRGTRAATRAGIV